MSTAIRPLELTPLTAISSLDGRYSNSTSILRSYVSEYSLFKQRIYVEIQWIKLMCDTPEFNQQLKPLSSGAIQYLDNIVTSFSIDDATQIKHIEITTKHDMKAVEYYIKNKFDASKLNELISIKEFIHFGCTSEDINNLSWSLILKTSLNECMIPLMNTLINKLQSMAHEYSDCAMLARTHGQPATPTTLGKEMSVFVYRLRHQLQLIQQCPILGKFNGATGNYNTHMIAYSNINWPELSKIFVTERLGLSFNPYTTQIESHDYNSQLFDTIQRFNTICIGLCRDIWGYISFNYFKQMKVDGEIGSSTMPHKINPIDFENSEGQLGLSNSLLSHISSKLIISRYQRDLTDSTVQRSMGQAYAHSLIAYNSLLRGLSKLQVNYDVISNDLNSNWEVLAEPIQTVMRKYSIDSPYEKLKELTQGKRVDQQMIQQFINKLEIPDDAKQILMKLTPHTYIGYAAELAKAI